jgi:ribulose-phosphate 3-epimerase
VLALDETYPSGRLAVEVSLWSADLGALATDVERVTPYADVFHIDVSDTRFVPTPLFFPDLVAALVPHTTVPFHAHVMAARATPLIHAFAACGVQMFTVHAEADDATEALAAAREVGSAAGLALRLDTPVEAIAAHTDHLDLVVLIGTPLGTQGTTMHPATPDRIRAVRAILASHGRAATPVIADGGIRADTVPALVAAGADAVVAGSLLLASPDRAGTAAWLHHHRSIAPAWARSES